MSGSASLSDRIAEDIRARRPFQRYADEIGTDLAKAYRVQDAVTASLLADGPGRRVAGYKLAFNKASSMEYYGLAEPCIAPVFSDLVHDSGVQFPADRYVDLVIEPELVMTLARDLAHDPERTDADLAAHIGPMRAGIELLDVRGAFAHDPSAAQAVAQGVYNVGAVVGSGAIELAALDLPNLFVTLRLDGKVNGEATGATPQHPLAVLRWLSERLHRDGRTLDAGMIVLCGTHLPPYPVAAPAAIDNTMGPLGTVSFSIG